MISPYNGKFKVSQQYKGNEHKGIDLVGIDNKEIHATVDGIVEIARWENSRNKKQGFGQYVMIKEYGTDRCFIYAHLSKILTKSGNIVHVGDVIGIEGTTGHSTGNHCHYEVRDGGITGHFMNINDISGIPNDEGGIYQNTSNNNASNNSDKRNYHTLYNMYVRCGAGLNYGIKLVKELTEDGKKNALDKGENNFAIYKKGTVFTALEIIENNYGKWARTPSGYVCIKGASGTIYSELD